MKNQRTSAVVLRRTNYGEADRILQLLTPMGKRSVMARGVRREKSKLSGGIELFAVSEVSIVEGRGTLDVLSSARLVKYFSNILCEYERMQFGYVVIKLISKASEMVEEPDWYDLIVETFAGLNSVGLSLDIIKIWFYIRYAALMGYELSLWRDNVGGKLLINQNYEYDISERGLVKKENGEITSKHIKLLRLAATMPLKTIIQVGGIDSVATVCLRVVQEHASI